jgi:predicted RNase H-like nuclease
MNEYVVSVDIAKKRDYTAIMIVKDQAEIIDGAPALRQPDRTAHRFDVVHIDKFQGLTYPAIAKTIESLMSHTNMRNNSDLLVDGTGVGEAIVDLLRERMLNPLPIVFTGGTQEREVYSEMGTVFQSTTGKLAGARIIKEIHVPKENLVSAGRIIIQQRRLRVAQGLRWAPEFEKQLLGFRGKVNEKRVKYEAETENLHDDLVVCYLMAAWWLNRSRAEERVLPMESDKVNDWNPMDF